MNEIKMCGIILSSLAICIVLKNLKQEYTFFIRIVVSLFVAFISLSVIHPLLSYISDISMNTPIYEYIPVLIKALSVAFIVQITQDVCNDSQESGLGEKIALFGKMEILLITFPLIKKVFELCKSLTS